VAKAEVPEVLRSHLEAEKARLERDAWQQELANLRAERAGLLARAEAERRSLAVQRDRAAGRVRELEESIERMTVRSPQAGLVLHQVNQWQSEKKKVGDQIWRGEVVLSIPDLTEMRALGTVDEADGGRLALGQGVVLRLEARPDLALEGTVRAIAPTVRRKSWQVPAKVFDVDIDLKRNLPELMRPAMRFRGDIVVERLAQRLLVPRDAVFLRASGPVVFKQRLWRWVETPVAVGDADARATEIREGLDAGDLVLPLDLAAAPAGALGRGEGVG
jgi:multidrug efflux pump subunit AcrA (membrane-fusion protein)